MVGTQPHKEQSRASQAHKTREKRGHSTRLRNKEEDVEARVWEEVRPSKALQPDFP